MSAKKVTVSTVRSFRNDADICRDLGWKAGTRLTDGARRPTVIEITAVGERHLLAREIAPDCVETMWTLSCRTWREVSA